MAGYAKFGDVYMRKDTKAQNILESCAFAANVVNPRHE